MVRHMGKVVREATVKTGLSAPLTGKEDLPERIVVLVRIMAIIRAAEAISVAITRVADLLTIRTALKEAMQGREINSESRDRVKALLQRARYRMRSPEMSRNVGIIRKKIRDRKKIIFMKRITAR